MPLPDTPETRALYEKLGEAMEKSEKLWTGLKEPGFDEASGIAWLEYREWVEARNAHLRDVHGHLRTPYF